MMNSVLAFGRAFAANPLQATYLAYSKVAPHRLGEVYKENCRKAGLKKPVFILSFDCDTQKDIRVVGDVHKRLTDMGVMPVYAVPGRLLEQGEVVYGKIAEEGAEFINHGYEEHCRLLDDGVTYDSSFFYDQLDNETIRKDVLDGDRTLRQVLGITPKGFRTPHFGSYQKQKHLQYLHSLLQELEYDFSTSTVPLAGLRWGVGFSKFGLPEFPLTGCPSEPLRMLDSWTFRFAPGRTVSESHYVQFAEQMIEQAETLDPYLINLYADPSQIHDWNDFFEVMEKLAPFNIPSYKNLLEVLNR